MRRLGRATAEFLLVAGVVCLSIPEAMAKDARGITVEGQPAANFVQERMGKAWAVVGIDEYEAAPHLKYAVAHAKALSTSASNESSATKQEKDKTKAKGQKAEIFSKAKDETGDSNGQMERDHVFINGVKVPQETLGALERAYGVPIQPGRYWYDKQSGLWGVEGLPLGGQIAQNLDLGGPLKADASKGDTGVFINGRELPIEEVAVLQQLGPVIPGRYWMNAQGVGGVEGGPAIFNIGAAIAAQNKKSGGMDGGWNRTTPGGHLGGDDNCSYFFDPASGASVMNCK